MWEKQNETQTEASPNPKRLTPNAATSCRRPQGGPRWPAVRGPRRRSALRRHCSCPYHRSRPPGGHRSRHGYSNNWSMFDSGSRRCVSHGYLAALQSINIYINKYMNIFNIQYFVANSRLFTENSMICVILRQ